MDLRTTEQNAPGSSATDRPSAVAALGLEGESFAISVRNWVKERSSSAQMEEELITLQSAIKIVERANPATSQIDIPLVPHLTVFAMSRELRQFSDSMLGGQILRRPIAASHRLLSKILGADGLEFNVNESAVKNCAVLGLLENLRSLLPEVGITLRGKWSVNSGLDSPEYFLRISLGSEKQKQGDDLDLTTKKNLSASSILSGVLVSEGLRETAGLVIHALVSGLGKGSKFACEAGLLIASHLALPSYWRRAHDKGNYDGEAEALKAMASLYNIALTVGWIINFTNPPTNFRLGAFPFFLVLATNTISGISELFRTGFRKAAERNGANVTVDNQKAL